MKQIEAIDLLKVFISDKIQQRRVEVDSVYSSSEEQRNQLDELRRLESTSRLQNSVFTYAKWYSRCNEIIVLENILCKIKDIERNMGEQVKSQNENDCRKR